MDWSLYREESKTKGFQKIFSKNFNDCALTPCCTKLSRKFTITLFFRESLRDSKDHIRKITFANVGL